MYIGILLQTTSGAEKIGLLNGQLRAFQVWGPLGSDPMKYLNRYKKIEGEYLIDSPCNAFIINKAQKGLITNQVTFIKCRYMDDYLLTLL